MPRISPSFVLAFAPVLAFCLVVSSYAQQHPVVSPPQLAAQASSQGEPDHQIKLDVVVTERGSGPLPGLAQQNFTVFDNKHPAQILTFQAEKGTALTPDAATEIVIVVDEVNTAFQRVTYERDELKRFLSQNGGKLAHPITLVFFSDLGTQIQAAPSTDGNQLVAALDQNANALRNITRSTGFYGAEERVQLSLKTLTELAAVEQKKPGRKMLIWISPGWPLLSGPRIDLSSGQQKSIFASVVDFSNALRKARITLYSVDPLGLADAGGLRTTYYEEYLKGVSGPNQAQLADLSLQVIATQSGGQVLFGNNSIQSGIERCIQDLDSFYTLTIPAAPADRSNDYHSIEVKMSDKGLTARTRTGYYAQP